MTTPVDLPPHPTTEDLFRVRVTDEPLVPVGGEPSPDDNSALRAALQGYAARSSPDDFSSLTAFLADNPQSHWSAALLTSLGLEYYATGYYSRALAAWKEAWEVAHTATEPKAKALADRALGELAYMYARLGRTTDLKALLTSVHNRAVVGPATERIAGAREGLYNMRHRPEVSFRCGPLALHRILLRAPGSNPRTDLIHAAESTQTGFSLRQIKELSADVGLGFQMAYREQGSEFIIPCVLHFNLDHYAALVDREDGRFVLEDPTFGTSTWATRAALEVETSGYCLLPAGPLPPGWRTVCDEEGGRVWGKGNVAGPEPGPHGPCDPTSGGDNECPSVDPVCGGLPRARVHLLLVSLNLVDRPIGYTPPVGPAVLFTLRYNQRDSRQPANTAYSNLGPKWTHDWLSYIQDNPGSQTADASFYMMGGGTRTFTGFDPATQAYAPQQYDQTVLTRTSPNSYELLARDGTRMIFARPDGSIGSGRNVFLTELIDPAGNAVTLTYDTALRLTTLTDALSQATTLRYDDPANAFLITKITDPFGRVATCEYDTHGRLIRISDVLALASEFTYDAGDFITNLTTPYGVTAFTKVEDGKIRVLETLFPDGERERVEFNQATNIPMSDPPASVPGGLATRNDYLVFRNTFYWDKLACALAYGDYTKARLYHWLHSADLHTAAGILESTKEPLEGRVWYDYPDQTTPYGPLVAGSSSRTAHIGRVLDDGSTQLYTNQYNRLGKVTQTVDPVGRTFAYSYAANDIDLVEIRQTRAGQNELLYRATYNDQHLPLTSTDASGQTTTYTYNARGQLTGVTDPAGGQTTYQYDAQGYRIAVRDPIGGTTRWTYDEAGRIRTTTDPAGYSLVFDYDALDRVTAITYPDDTQARFSYTLLDLTEVTDRAGRQTTFAYNSARELAKRTDPLGRAIQFVWCKCGGLKSFTDALGRTTTWHYDVQGRVTAKEYVDGTQIEARYELTTSRLRQRIDEQGQITQYTYNRDDTLSSKTYTNILRDTPGVAFQYDPDYERVTVMTDGMGSTRYSYYPIAPAPTLGAGRLASLEGPAPFALIRLTYDAVGRRVSVDVDGTAAAVAYDAVGRPTQITNALGQFSYGYDGSTRRITAIQYPNGQQLTATYMGPEGDCHLQRLRSSQGAQANAEFVYSYDSYHLATGTIQGWSQAGEAIPAAQWFFGYDACDRLTNAAETFSGGDKTIYSYTYDAAGNRLSEVIGDQAQVGTYNALNQLTAVDGDTSASAAYEWDADQRLVAVTTGDERTEYVYDGRGRRAKVRSIVSGTATDQYFVYYGSDLVEERDATGLVRKRFFRLGMTVEDGTRRQRLYYTHDHLGSVREVRDEAGALVASYNYDPFGRASLVAGTDVAQVGFAGYVASQHSGLSLAVARAYDPSIGRWLSRDPLPATETGDGSCLYSYSGNDPVNRSDPLGAQSPIPWAWWWLYVLMKTTSPQDAPQGPPDPDTPTHQADPEPPGPPMDGPPPPPRDPFGPPGPGPGNQPGPGPGNQPGPGPGNQPGPGPGNQPGPGPGNQPGPGPGNQPGPGPGNQPGPGPGNQPGPGQGGGSGGPGPGNPGGPAPCRPACRPCHPTRFVCN